MTWVKKLKSEWEPQEHQGILVGDVVDFGGPVQRLVEEGSVALCDEDGNEISAYDVFGVVTDREMEEFRAWKEMQRQQKLKATLEKERDELIAEAAALKAENKPATPETIHTTQELREEKKKSDFGARMAAARAAKKAAKAVGETK